MTNEDLVVELQYLAIHFERTGRRVPAEVMLKAGEVIEDLERRLQCMTIDRDLCADQRDELLHERPYDPFA